MSPVYAAWRVQRNATETREIAVPGFDLRGQDQLLQIRLYRDAPDLPLISLSLAPLGSQGLSVSYAVENGTPTSTIVAQIDRVTLQNLLPFVENGTDPGTDVVLAYDHLIALPGDTLKPVYRGAFIIEPGVSVPWTVNNVPALPGVPEAEELGAAITRANTAAGLGNAAAANASAKTIEAQTVINQGQANGVLRNYRDPTLSIVARIGSPAWPAVTNDPAAPGLRAYTAISDGSSLRTTTFGAVFTFTRAGTAQARNAAGAIVTAAANAMRLDHRYNLATSGWMLAGILLQTQRTNTFLQSQDWTVVTNGWSNTGAGNSTATAIIEDASNGQHFKAAAGANTQSFTAGVMQVLSFRASERTGSAKRLALAFLTGTVLAANGSAVFDLATGTAYTNGGGGTTFADCISDGPGSWICWWRFTPTGTATNAVRIGLANAPTATTSSYQGDGTSGLNITDVQLEVGSTPSARIPTTTTQGTRLADVLIQSLGIEFNPAAGTEFVSVRWPAIPIAASTARLVQIDDGTEANRITTRLGGGAIVAEIVVGGTVIASVTGPTIAKDADYLVKTAWQTGQLSLTVGAVTYTDAAPANLPAGLTTRRIGCDSAGGGQPNAWIRTHVDHPTDHTRDASAYARALTSAERQVYA